MAEIAKKSVNKVVAWLISFPKLSLTFCSLKIGRVNVRQMAMTFCTIDRKPNLCWPIFFSINLDGIWMFVLRYVTLMSDKWLFVDS